MSQEQSPSTGDLGASLEQKYNQWRKTKRFKVVDLPGGSYTIVYGPQGCGKTLSARAMARHFGHTRIVDGWQRGDLVRPGALHLTHEDLSDVKVPRGVRVVPFSQWQKQARRGA